MMIDIQLDSGDALRAVASHALARSRRVYSPVHVDDENLVSARDSGLVVVIGRISIDH